MEFVINVEQLDDFAAKFWDLVKDARVFAFHGEMGAGKTTVISALCHHKGTHDVTGSPTFSIINEYQAADGEKIYHIDLYRLKDEEEVMSAGVEDCVYSGSLCMVEWPEKAPWLFDEQSIHVFIEPLSASERRVVVKKLPVRYNQ